MHDPDKTIAQGAVRPWSAGGRRLFAYADGGSASDWTFPIAKLNRREFQIVLRGEPAQRRVTFQTRDGRTVSLNVT